MPDDRRRDGGRRDRQDGHNASCEELRLRGDGEVVRGRLVAIDGCAAIRHIRADDGPSIVIRIGEAARHLRAESKDRRCRGKSGDDQHHEEHEYLAAHQREQKGNIRSIGGAPGERFRRMAAVAP